MKILKSIFSKRNSKTTENSLNITEVNIEINDKITPIDRGDLYEDPLSTYLKKNSLGKIVGSGTMQLSTGEIKYCDIQIEINSNNLDNTIKRIIQELEDRGIPKGSKLTIKSSGKIINFGNKEGLALYLDGKNLEKEVYINSDSNFVVAEIKKSINDSSEIVRYWENDKQTVLYFYGNSYEQMVKDISKFTGEYPLCKGVIIKQIA